MAGSKPGRPGARKPKKGPTKGTGGKNKSSLEGRGPTPKAEDRAWHPAGKRKAAQERFAAAGGKPRGVGGKTAGGGSRSPKQTDDTETPAARCESRATNVAIEAPMSPRSAREALDRCISSFLQESVATSHRGGRA